MERLPAGMRKEEERRGCHQLCWVVLRAEVCVCVCVGELWEGTARMRVAVSGLMVLCVQLCASGPFSNKQPSDFPPTCYCCGQKAGDQPSGRHLWALNSPLSYAPRTMGLFLHKMGMRDPVMDL